MIIFGWDTFILHNFEYLIFLFDDNENKNKIKNDTEEAIKQIDFLP